MIFILTLLEYVLFAEDSLFSCYQQSLWRFFSSRSLLKTITKTWLPRNAIRNAFTWRSLLCYILRLATSFRCFSMHLMSLAEVELYWGLHASFTLVRGRKKWIGSWLSYLGVGRMEQQKVPYSLLQAFGHFALAQKPLLKVCFFFLLVPYHSKLFIEALALENGKNLSQLEGLPFTP